MTELEQSRRWVLAYLVIAHIALWWTVANIAWHHIKEWFL